MNIVLFSGTTEGRELSEYLSMRGVKHTVCVATESGQAVMDKSPYARICVGRLSEDEMSSLLIEEGATHVLDATHPYAENVTRQLQEVCNRLGTEYMRVLREAAPVDGMQTDVSLYESAKDCADALAELKGNVLLTTGSKELKCYTANRELIDRLYVRVLPTSESIELCKRAGIDEKHIIAMYGPHTEGMNIAVMQQYGIGHLVTKESGSAGGYMEKLSAAREAGAMIHIIKRPADKNGMTPLECKGYIDELVRKATEPSGKLLVSLVGCGMGDEQTITVAGRKAINEADYIFGAKRLVGTYEGKAQVNALYMPEDIIEYIEKNIPLEACGQIRLAVMFSGDVGVYSGATKLYTALKTWGKCTDIRLIPGISTFSAFAAVIGREYTGARLESIHGKTTDVKKHEKIRQLIESGERLFILMSGKGDFQLLSSLIPEPLQGKIKITIGYNIAYEDQRVIYTDGAKLYADTRGLSDGLYIALVESEEQ